MHYNISKNPKKEYVIKTPGEHIFYFENISEEITFIIKSENAVVNIYGIYVGEKKDQFNLTINQIHEKPNSQSIALIKSVLDDASSLRFTGRIRIEKEARNSKALLTNKNLLLSKNSSVISIPQLEVLPHEVECTHAAVTAPLDQDQLYYMTTRGITHDKATELLINGFTQEILRHKK